MSARVGVEIVGDVPAAIVAARKALNITAQYAGLFVVQCCFCEGLKSISVAAPGDTCGLSHGLHDECVAPYSAQLRAEMLAERMAS